MVSRRNSYLHGFMLILALLTPTMAQGAFFAPAGTDAEYVTGVDAGLGPGWSSSTSPNLNSVMAASLFQQSLGANAKTTMVDFGSAFSSWSLKGNNSWTSAVDRGDFSGLKAMTTGIDYSTPPAPYQYGITNVTNSVASNAFLGYGVDGPSHYEFVPSLSAASASLTIHSNTAFEAFGFYLTGLGNTGGVVDVAIDRVKISELSLRGASNGGVLYLGYLGDKPIHDIRIMMTGNGVSRDVFGISKLELAQVIPEPSSLVLSAIFGAGILGRWLVRKGGLRKR